MSTYQSDDKRIALQAAEWLVRLRDATPQDKAAFSAWLLESRRHVRNLLLLLAMEKELGGLDPEHRHDIDALLVQARATPVPHPATLSVPRPAVGANPAGRKRRWALTAAGIAAALIMAVTVNLHMRRPVEYVTATGEQRSVKLPDGSLVHLNTRSRLTLNFSPSRRDVRLIDGEAFFVVQHDASRPFRVITDTAVAQAVGTQFNVYSHDAATTISVVEGRVQVSAAGAHDAVAAVEPPLAPLSAGQTLTLAHDGRITRRAAVDPTTITAWRERRLSFQDDSLATIVAQLNRYNTLQIHLEGEELQQRTFTGVLDAEKPESLLRLLSKEGDLSFVQRGNEIVVRAKR